MPTYKILVVSLPDSPKREFISEQLSHYDLPWSWVDGVIVASLSELNPEEYSGMEAYCIPRLKTDPIYLCRATGCKRAMKKAIDIAATCTEDWVIILQDDASLVEDFNDKVISLFTSLPDEVDSVMLHRVGGGVKEENGLLKVTGNVRSMCAFAVRPSFASIMSDALSHWHGEADRIWERLARQGKTIISASPQLVHCNQKGSDIIGGIPELKHYWA